MRTTGRVALDVLKPAHHQRKLYVGEWLPEPIPGHGGELTGSSAESYAVLQTEVSYGLMVGLRQKYPEAEVERVTLAGGEQGALLRPGEEVGGLIACGTSNGVIAQVWIMRNPEKLQLWQ